MTEVEGRTEGGEEGEAEGGGPPSGIPLWTAGREGRKGRKREAGREGGLAGEEGQRGVKGRLRGGVLTEVEGRTEGARRAKPKGECPLRASPRGWRGVRGGKGGCGKRCGRAVWWEAEGRTDGEA